MKIVTSRQMKELDNAAISRHGIASLQLMERAGSGVANFIISKYGKRGQIAVICGKGNNGGDGLVAARYLIDDGYDVSVFILDNPNSLSPDAKANFDRLAVQTTHIYNITDSSGLNSNLPTIARSSLIVDAIFGTGLEREVSGLYAQAISFINSLKMPVISIDVPSGLSSDNGQPQKEAFEARATVTLGLPKLGLFVGSGQKYSGKIEVVDIGIPKEETDKLKTEYELICPAMLAGLFKKREPSSHKGTYGHVIVFAGQLGHLGAGYLACMSALRSGAGLVTYCLPAKAFVRFDARYPEIMCDPVPDDGTSKFHPNGLPRALELCKDKSIVIIGPAIGEDTLTKSFANDLIKNVKVPLVIDADGLNVLDLNSVKKRTSPTILTPHPGEMGRLLHISAADVQNNRIESAQKLASQTGAYVILKGNGTIIATPESQILINQTGNAGMATAGMGDALTGVIASFIAQGMAVKDACAAAVYIHGVAGDLASSEHGERALITSDVIKCLGEAIKTIET